ncbi:hypothetical protein PYTT13_21030 (plasmid) [Paracoccus yeei]|uniref:Uncharacterized protein n=1 Tax=Paracoccus yeei TaxID=147645 RepID=A0A2D2C750_9RHOB|nr:hypothetical protein PYTT13_21030 [Paracoccus yeei]
MLQLFQLSWLKRVSQRRRRIQQRTSLLGMDQDLRSHALGGQRLDLIGRKRTAFRPGLWSRLRIALEERDQRLAVTAPRFVLIRGDAYIGFSRRQMGGKAKLRGHAGRPKTTGIRAEGIGAAMPGSGKVEHGSGGLCRSGRRHAALLGHHGNGSASCAEQGSHCQRLHRKVLHRTYLSSVAMLTKL